MQRVDGSGRGRGYAVTHQKVALELSFSAKTVAQGYTELIIQPSDKALKTVHLNCRQLEIQRVTCAGQPADFSVVDHLTNASIANPKDIHLYPELKRKLFAAASDSSAGELSILIPFDVTQETSEEATFEFAPFTVRIYYSISEAYEAIQVIRPTQDAPYRVPHMYTSSTCPDFARCWVPCVDSLWERCTWEIELVVPKEIEGEAILAIASGDLVEQINHPYNSQKVIFYFSQAVATSVQHIAFAAGPFILYDVPLSRNNEEKLGQVLAFCFPGREEEMRTSVGVVHQAFDFFSREFGSYPFGSYKVAFIDDPVVDVFNSSTLALCSSDLLYPPSVIDQALETRHILSHCVAFQWVGINIVQKTWSDTWLINGLSLYITGLFLRRLLGNNEYKFRLKKDSDRLFNCDIAKPPLCVSGRQEPPEESQLAFINLKAPLILHILDRRLCKAGASLGLGRVIPKVFLQAITGEMANATLSTSSFLRTCRKVSGIDLKRFAEQWIYGSGCPQLHCNANFNKKKLMIEFNISQVTLAHEFAKARPLEAAGSNPVQVFEGQMTVRIHEADGTPYEHVFDINSANKRFEVPFNTKYKRVRRNTKRFKSRQAAAQAAAEGDEGAAEDISLMDLGFGLGLWEDEEQREKWKVADWTEEDEAQMSSAPYEWIRLDADFEWLGQIIFDQRDYMWVSQLQRDRDVVAQMQAIEALGRRPDPISSSMLARTVLVTKYFFRIRIEAIHNLVACALQKYDYLGLFHLLMLFRTTFCHDVPEEAKLGLSELDVPCIPRANDFSDFAAYFIRRALIQAISNVRNDHGRTLPQVKKFLINLLRYNDNSTNKYVDDFYLSGLITCLANVFVPKNNAWNQYVPPNEDPDAVEDEALLLISRQEVERFQELDKLVPSYHNVVSMACLDYQTSMMLANLIPVNLPMLHAYTRPGNFVPLRIVALDYLLLLRGLHHKTLTRYFFALLKIDESRTVKRALGRSMCEAFAVMILIADKRESLAVLDSSKGSSSDLLEDMIKYLRRDVGRSASVREGYLDALLQAGIDSGQRWALLKLGELLFRPAEEKEVPFQPKMSLRVRVPTVVEPQEMIGESAPLPTPTTATKIKLIRSDTSGTTPRVAFDESAAKKKKAKPTVHGQESGMTLPDLTACRNCLQKLQRSKHSHLFLKPVDPVRDRAPDYFKIISNPIDLSSIGYKLNEGMYKNRFEFKEDVALLIANAKTYTPDEKAYVHIEANALEKDFNVVWTRITKTLEQAAARTNQRNQHLDDEAASTSYFDSASGALSEGQSESIFDDGASSTVAESMPPPPPPVLSKGLGGIKIKLKPRVSSETPAPSMSPPAPKIAIKKESSPAIERKKTLTPSPAPSVSPRQSPSPAQTLSSSKKTNGPSEDAPMQVKKCLPIIRMLMKHPQAWLFLRPVDPVADGVPTYLDEIAHPMDFGTIEGRLQNGKYATMNLFHDDVMLVFSNCRTFNPPGTEPVAFADTLERLFLKEWKTAMTPKLEYVESRALQSLLTKLKNAPFWGLFSQAVDPIALGIPHYFNVIRKEDARDLSLIEAKLKRGSYTSIYDLDQDVKLMLKNCYIFNKGDESIIESAKAFERYYDRMFSEVKSRFGKDQSATTNGSGGVKRKAEGEANGSTKVVIKKKT